MIKANAFVLTATLGIAAAATPLSGQTWSIDDPVLTRIWEMGMNESHAPEIAQTLMDSIGPRLTGAPGIDRASDWATALTAGWGLRAWKEPYGTWVGWERGTTHVDLIAPRVRTLEATMLAWSPGTDGPVEGPVVALPEFASADEAEAWLDTVRGKFVAISFPQPTCRPDDHYEEWGTPGALERLDSARTAAREAFQRRVPSLVAVRAALEAAGAAGTLESMWAGDVGTNTVYSTTTSSIPSLDFSCEDYGLLWRLAENEQGPVLRVDATAEFLGEVPVYNTLAEIRGSELPGEYVMLSAHFDSWDSSSGATDNGTGSVVMLEAMRILSEVYSNPRRTIRMALWGGEEQGLNGSRRYVAMHPEVAANVQALFNQDVGTGRVVRISGQGLLDAGASLSDWLSRIPNEITREIELDLPGLPSRGGSDHSSFICAGAPAFNLSSESWGYGPFTWHTNRDTYDKVVFEEIRSNATLVAMLAYLASEDRERVGRAQRVLPPGEDGSATAWPECQPGREGL